MKQHLTRVKGDIGPCKSVPPYKVKKRFKKCKVLWKLIVEKGKKLVVDKYFAPRNTQEAQPSMKSVLAGKDVIWRADMVVGRFFYDACIPINAVNSFYFKPMLDAISAIDDRQRTLINFFVYCPEGISFVKSVDASDIVKDATNLFQLFDEDIGKMYHVTELVRRASKVTIFVYNHVALLSWLRKREGWTEILRPGATRFATTFIALKSLHDHKHDLQALENFCNKPNVIGSVMDVIDQKVLKSKLETMNEMKLFRVRLGSFGRDLAYSSREVLQPVDDDQLAELDVEELENLLYEKGSIPINEVEGLSSHIDDEDGGDVAIEGLDMENFGFPDAHVQSPYSNFQNE
ncbi:hypothetical protein CK203_083892 [Vitis vinifera]|uniref:DUF659 domain-containing protein n=1 Tax=Vitis vinifera TaxID=29760 RepID=A0A438BUD2_VITVI|nr:hypothetical protein CK203_083892 [Vitis vinifera]